MGPKPKVQIEYPPLTLRKWKPPRIGMPHDPKRKKPFVRKPIFPKKFVHLNNSTLKKIWHRYQSLTGSMFILRGHFNQYSRRFNQSYRGRQQGASCLACLGIIQMVPPDKWNEYTIDNILYLGNRIYAYSCYINRKKNIDCLYSLYTNIYINYLYLVLCIEDPIQGKLYKEDEYTNDLLEAARNFFVHYSYGVLEIEGRQIFLFRHKGAYYFFDPHGRNEFGERTKKILPHGEVCINSQPPLLATVMRFLGLRTMISNLQENVDEKDRNLKFVLYPVTIKRKELKNFNPPKTVEEFRNRSKYLEEKQILAKRDALREGPVEVPLPTYEDDLKKLKERPEGEEGSLEMLQEPPIEGPQEPSVTYFHEIEPAKFGILQACFHQNDPNCSRFPGKQSLANAVAAIAMLRQHKARHWVKSTLDSILFTAEAIYLDSLKNLQKNQELGIKELTDRIKISDKVYTPTFDDTTVFGTLGSTKFDVLDLKSALEEFFTEHDTGIILGPNTIGVWCEQGRYYMFDPNERDGEGRIILPKKKPVETDPKEAVEDEEDEKEKGVACLTWHSTVESLVELYMKNLAPNMRKEPFKIDAVEVKDFSELPNPWHNFNSTEYGRWILRGFMHQDDKSFGEESRDQQGTAMAAMALAFAEMKPINTWERKTIDEILIAGDTLYTESVNHLKTKNKFKNPKLFASEVLTRFQIMEEDIVLTVDECVINGLVDTPDGTDVLNLKKGLEKFFDRDNMCILTAKGLSLALWKDNETYYLFDSHTRNEKGYSAFIGTACAVRFLNVEDMTKFIMANLQPDRTTLYNLSRIEVAIWPSSDGLSRPPLNNFTELNPQVAILRSNTHEGDKDLFDIFADKQTVPNILIGLAMPRILPTHLWCSDTLDQILQMGEKLYEDSRSAMVKNEKFPPKAPPISESEEPSPFFSEMVEEEEPSIVDESDEQLLIDNVQKEYKIGLNKFTFSYPKPTKAQIEDDPMMKPKPPKGKKKEEDNTFSTMQSVVVKPVETLEKILRGFLEEEGDSVKQAIIKTDQFYVGVWREDGVFYLFDPQGRDSEGKPLGRELWSAKHYPEEPMGEEDQKRLRFHESAVEESKMLLQSQGNIIATKSQEVHGEDEHIPSFTISTISLDMANAKAYVMQFLSVDKMIEHIIESIPPNKRENKFKFYPIKLENVPDIKPKAFPTEPSLGNWHNFQEIDLTEWILRGTLNMNTPMYPICNRGNQYVAMCLVALGFSKLFELEKFNKNTVNDILKYGDRMHTLLTKSRTENAKKANPEMPPAELCFLLNKLKITTADLMKTFYIFKYALEVEVTQNVATGDVTVIDPEEIPDILTGVSNFFAENDLGIFTCKNKSVALWKKDDHYYLFDPDSRGPSGLSEENGFACITRHKNLSSLVSIIQHNLDKDGSNDFFIDSIQFKVEYAQRPEPQVEKVIATDPKVTAFEEIIPGKLILSGNFNQNNPKFEKMVNATTAANAFVALAMSLIHKTETWTKPIIDEILTNGNLLYDISKENLAFCFNPWEDAMTLDIVNKTFRVGVWEATIELCDNVEEGVLDIKHPTIPNLRRGLENFFRRSTHGIIDVDCQTVAIWTENDLLYLFDPYPRSSTGLYQVGGNACLMVFKDTKMMSDHFLQNTPCGDCEFRIVPAKIRVCELKDCKKKPLLKCEILRCKDIKIFDKGDDKEPCRGVEINNECLPCCEDVQLTESDEIRQRCLKIQEKKKWARAMSEQRQRKQMEKQNRRMKFEFICVGNGMSILRGSYSQNHHRFGHASRNKQSIPNAIVAIVMSKLHDPATWTYKNIDIILDSGDALYKDSWWYYKPYNPNLGLKNILRTFHIEHCKVTTHIYKSAIMGDLVFRALYVGLLNFFLHETSGIVYTKVYNVAVFQKAGCYYMFDPYDRDREGNVVRCGVACCLKFDNVENMSKKIINTAMTYACDCECGRMIQFGDECLEEKKSDESDMRYCIHAVTLENLTPIPVRIVIEESESSCRSGDYV